MLTVVRGQKWKDIRSILTPTFSASKIKQVSVLLQENKLFIANEADHSLHNNLVENQT